jgi:hypothetical protein
MGVSNMYGKKYRGVVRTGTLRDNDVKRPGGGGVGLGRLPLGEVLTRNARSLRALSVEHLASTKKSAHPIEAGIRMGFGCSMPYIGLPCVSGLGC